MKSKDIKQKSEELAEKAEQAEDLEVLIRKADKAEWYIQEVLDGIGNFDIPEPHGWLSEIVFNLTEILRERLEAL